MELLKAVRQHRAVALLDHVTADLGDKVRPDSDDVAVVGGVMDLAQSQPVRNDRSAPVSVPMMCAVSSSSGWRSRQSAQDFLYALRTRSRNDGW